MSSIISHLATQGFVSFPDNLDWKHRFQIKSGTSARIYMIGRHRVAGVWVCSCPGFRSGRHCKHLRAVWQVLVAVDGFDGVARDADNRWAVDFGVPWLPLPDDDIFYARHPHVAIGQRPFGTESYPQYDQSEGRGSRGEWAKVSEEILTKLGVRPEDFTTYAKQHGDGRTTPNSKSRADRGAKHQRARTAPPRHDPLMKTLGISEVPRNLAEFKTAARIRIMNSHPDHGGSAEEFRTVWAAYETLALRIFGVRV